MVVPDGPRIRDRPQPPGTSLISGGMLALMVFQAITMIVLCA